MPKRVDRLLIAAALVLAAAIAWDSLGHRATHATVQPPPAAAAVPELVRLVPSSTAFLPNCPTRDLHLSLGPENVVTLRFAGRRCHVPPLKLQATLRSGAKVVYRGPALASEALSGNYAGSGESSGELLGCPGGANVVARVSGSGLSASARIRCP
jgi:hypothetical protein